jgi:hypothetical protein
VGAFNVRAVGRYNKSRSSSAISSAGPSPRGKAPPFPLTPGPRRNIMGRLSARRSAMRIGVILLLALGCAAQAAEVIVGAKESPQKGPWCGT